MDRRSETCPLDARLRAAPPGAVDGAAESGAPDVSLHVDRVHVLHADEQTVQSTKRPFAGAAIMSTARGMPCFEHIDRQE